MPGSYRHWLFRMEDHICFLTLNRPEKKNRIDQTTLEELGALCRLIREDSSIWAVVVQANGECFSAGVDVSLIGSMIGQDYDTYRQNLAHAQSFFDEFEALRKPTIAALKGPVIGGGMILSVCCDFRIAADNTVFELPEVKRSIGVIMGTQRITRLIGVAHTKEMAMLGRKVEADRALQIGLVNEVVPLEELDERTQAFAEQFLKLPPLAVGLNKRIIDEGQFLERAGQDLEIEAQAEILESRDFKEAIESFFARRDPNFTGE